MSVRRLTVVLVLFTVVAFAGTLEAQGKARIAVVNFENNSSWSWWGDQLGAAAADELATHLVRSGKFTVIERRQLESLLVEQNFGASGRVDPSTASEIGKLLGAQVVVTGSITQFSIETKRAGIGGIGASFTEAESKLDVRVVNTVTGEIMVVAEGEGKKRLGGIQINNVNFQQNFDAGLAAEALRPAVETAIDEIVDQADQFAQLAPVAPPASIVGSNDGNFYIDRGENFGVQVGQRFAVMRVVDEIKDSAGNVLDRITDRVGILEVTRVLSQSSICTLVEGQAAEGDQLVAQ